MVLINELTVEQINAALLHLQRSKDETVGGEKGTTIQNISISNSGGGGGNNVDYSSTIRNLAKLITTNTTAIEKNANDIANLKSKFSTIEQSVEDTLQGLVDNGISDLSYDNTTKQLTITTNAGDTYLTTIEQDIGYLSFDSATNKLTLTTGGQAQDITLPYINSSEKGSANGVATLDENGRVPYSQLPESAMEFLGQWDASTNTPHLADGTGTNGDFYIVSAGGTVNLGTAQDPHIITFSVNDRIVYEGDVAQWVRLPAGQVSSVNGQSGVVTLTANDIEYSTGVSIKDKIDANAVQSDWNQSCSACLSYILNKPTILSMVNNAGSTTLPIILCTGNDCVGRSTCFAFSANPSTGYLYTRYLMMGKGECDASAGIIRAWGACSCNNMICFLNNTCNANGNGISIGGGGVLIMGSGESAQQMWCCLNGSTCCYGQVAQCEATYLLSDDVMHFCAGVNCGLGNAVDGVFKLCTIDGCNRGVFVADCFWGVATCADTLLKRTYVSQNVNWDIPLWSTCNTTYRCIGSHARLTFCLDTSNCGHLTTDYIHGSVSCATWAKYSECVRPTSANILAKNNTAGLTHFLATSSMAEAKPSRDGHIMHMSWDSTGGYGAQFFIANNISGGCVPQYRAENGGTWSAWHDFITDVNISTQHVACADHATCADSASSTGEIDGSLICSICGVSIRRIGMVSAGSYQNAGMYALVGNLNCISECDFYNLLFCTIYNCSPWKSYPTVGCGKFESATMGHIEYCHSPMVVCDLSNLFMDYFSVRIYDNGDDNLVCARRNCTGLVKSSCSRMMMTFTF